MEHNDDLENIMAPQKSPKIDIFGKINKIVPIITAFTMAVFTILLWIATSESANESKKVVEMEKYRQTLLLCKDYRNWFVYETGLLKTDSLLFELKAWEGSLQDSIFKSRWIDMPDSIRLTELRDNISVRRLFSYFEDAMILHQKGLLDDTYFFNFFYNPFRRLEKTSEPEVDVYIESMRTEFQDSLIYEGYYYCRDKILDLYKGLNENQRNAVDSVKKYKKITKEEYQNLFNISSAKSLMELNDLVEKQIFATETVNDTIYYKL